MILGAFGGSGGPLGHRLQFSSIFWSSGERFGLHFGSIFRALGDFFRYFFEVNFWARFFLLFYAFGLHFSLIFWPFLRCFFDVKTTRSETCDFHENLIILMKNQWFLMSRGSIFGPKSHFFRLRKQYRFFLSIFDTKSWILGSMLVSFCLLWGYFFNDFSI